MRIAQVRGVVPLDRSGYGLEGECEIGEVLTLSEDPRITFGVFHPEGIRIGVAWPMGLDTAPDQGERVLLGFICADQVAGVSVHQRVNHSDLLSLSYRPYGPDGDDA